MKAVAFIKNASKKDQNCAIGQTLPPFSVQTSKRLALGCNGLSQQDVQHGRGIVQKKMFFFLNFEFDLCVRVIL